MPRAEALSRAPRGAESRTLDDLAVGSEPYLRMIHLRRAADLLSTFAISALVLYAGCANSRAEQEPSYLFVWAADADSSDSDFLAVVNATPGHPGYGRVVATAPAGATGTMAHHTEAEMSEQGELLANGFAANVTFRFDLRQPTHPRLTGMLEPAPPYFHPHSFARLPSGHVLATYQYQGPDHASPGGLVEHGLRGEVVRSGSAVDSLLPDEFVRPYSLAIAPGVDRVLTTGHDMHRGGSNRAVQVWRLSDLQLLNTLLLEPGPRGDEHVSSYEPRILEDGSTAMVSTRSCGLYRIDDFGGDSPVARHVHTFDDRVCFVPVVIGRYWIQPLGTTGRIVVLDVTDPTRPVRTSELHLGSGNTPHWLARSGDRLVITGFDNLRHRVLIARFDRSSGEVQLDSTFRSPESSEPGVSFERDVWPHGSTGPAIPHGAVFSRR